MKRNLIFLLLVTLVLGFSNSSQAQCPEDAMDLGECDTLHVVPWPKTDTCFDGECINDPGKNFPCFLHVSLFVTHDSNTFYWPGAPGGPDWVQDSISAFVIPLTFWHPPGGCADSVILPDFEYGGFQNWNNTECNPALPEMSRSIFRDLVDTVTNDTTFNRMLDLARIHSSLVWATRNLDIEAHSCAGDSGHAFLAVIPSDPRNRRWWEGDRVLLATYTFMVYKSAGCDTARICFDSTLWPPTSRLKFTRYDAKNYFPRHNLPICFKLYGDSVFTGMRWIEGSTEEEGKPISFSVSQNYPNPFNPITNFKVALPKASHVKIEIFNILGQKVKTLVDEDLRAGVFVVDWDGTDQRGLEVSSGIYFYRIITDDFSDIKRMVLLK